MTLGTSLLPRASQQKPVSAHVAECLHVRSFNIGATAASTSQLAGVLAGFAFFAVIYVLTTNVDRRSAGRHVEAVLDRALLTLFCATFGLAIAAIQYSILAGNTGAGLVYGRGASEELFADITFGLAIYTLVAGMLSLVALEDFGRTLRFVRTLAAIAAPPALAFFVANAAGEVAVGIWAGRDGLLLCGHNGLYSAVQTWGERVIPLVVLVASIGVWLGPSLASRRWLTERHGKLEAISTAPPVASLLATVVALTVGVSFDEYHVHSHISAGVLWSALVAASALTLFQAFGVRYSTLTTVEADITRDGQRHGTNGSSLGLPRGSAFTATTSHRRHQGASSQRPLPLSSDKPQSDNPLR
jgi:hypothetical protein